jgi:hypothetical protein
MKYFKSNYYYYIILLIVLSIYLYMFLPVKNSKIIYLDNIEAIIVIKKYRYQKFSYFESILLNSNILFEFDSRDEVLACPDKLLVRKNAHGEIEIRKKSSAEFPIILIKDINSAPVLEIIEFGNESSHIIYPKK